MERTYQRRYHAALYCSHRGPVLCCQSCQPGQTVTVFMSGEDLYANTEGVKSSTPLAMVYFGFLSASFAMAFVTITLAGRARRRS